ncbi:hypothetical protein B0A49_07590 [Cryomyces minteri]|uniref:Pre-mRNA-splicing factor 38B n=1 Tax=Cryomyces minteri TaxID=331657 RepID=A0A4U0WNN1_9PEZI|nr:hypothetical protein B0A49_07590 [Cryomyces minteri]
MPADTPLTDDYVADLLAKDARASSIRYSTMGMGALLPSRPTGAARKPNTRFLRNILKETDTHNAALLAREAEEAKARLRKLRGERETKGKPEQMRYDVRSRVERGPERQGKRRRVDEDERDDRDKRHRSEDAKSHGSTNPTKPTSARDRAPSPPTSTRSASSDPLSPLLGPLPAPKVQARGRGAFTGSSGAIDTHFAASYDPGTDVSLGLDDPDAAGFGEDEVRKWEARKGTADGERERDEKDVKWKGRGEGREWDRGKVLGEDGVELMAEWGRLKGT